MRLRFIPVTLPLVVVVCSCIVAAACTSPSLRSNTATDGPIDEKRARALFQQSCRSCHTLDDANAHGTFGPDLDDVRADLPRIREQIRDGGGGMPPRLLDGEEADLVARYVAEVAGGALLADGAGNTPPE